MQQTPQTAEQIATGRRVGAEIATHLVQEIRSMGLPAERASTPNKPEPARGRNGVVIKLPPTGHRTKLSELKV